MGKSSSSSHRPPWKRRVRDYLETEAPEYAPICLRIYRFLRDLIKKPDPLDQLQQKLATAEDQLQRYQRQDISLQSAIGLKKRVEKPEKHADLALFCILPPTKSGIAHYSYEVFKSFPHLTDVYCHFDTYLERLEANKVAQGLTMYHPSDFPLIHKMTKYPRALFVLGNSSHNLATLRAFLDYAPKVEQNILYLHDVTVAILWKMHFAQNFARMQEFFLKHYPEKTAWIRACTTCNELLDIGVQGIRPLLKLGHNTTILVNNMSARELVLSDLDEATRNTVIETAFLPILPTETVADRPRTNNILTMAHFGVLGAIKKPELLIETCKKIREHRPVKLIFAGWGNAAYFAAQREKLPDFVEVYDSPSNTTLTSLMQKTDIAIQLRGKAHGESSGVINTLLALEKPIIATRVGSFQALEKYITLVPVEADADHLAATILHVAGDLEGHSRKTAGAREEFSVEKFFVKLEQACSKDVRRSHA